MIYHCHKNVLIVCSSSIFGISHPMIYYIYVIISVHLHSRVRKNPRQYGFGNAKNEADLESLLREACIT